jgi:hypothetical protein
MHRGNRKWAESEITADLRIYVMWTIGSFGETLGACGKE